MFLKVLIHCVRALTPQRSTLVHYTYPFIMLVVVAVHSIVPLCASHHHARLIVFPNDLTLCCLGSLLP
jgi:hypothetical protein